MVIIWRRQEESYQLRGGDYPSVSTFARTVLILSHILTNPPLLQREGETSEKLLRRFTRLVPGKPNSRPQREKRWSILGGKIILDPVVR